MFDLNNCIIKLCYILQEQKLSNHIQKRGALYALKTICIHFGDQLQSKLPRLFEIVYDGIKNFQFPENDPSKLNENLIKQFYVFVIFKLLGMDTLKEKDEEVQELIKHLQVFEVVCSKIHKCFVLKVIYYLNLFNVPDNVTLNVY